MHRKVLFRRPNRRSFSGSFSTVGLLVLFGGLMGWLASAVSTAGRAEPARTHPLGGLALAQVGGGQRASTFSENRTQLTNSELAELKLKKNRYDNMPQSKQQRLRDLHRQIMQRDDSDELLQIMLRYNEWIKSLTERQRATLREMDNTERIVAIREIRQQQAEEEFGKIGDTQLPKDDVPKLFQWVDKFMSDNRERMISELDRFPRGNSGRRSRGTIGPWGAFSNLANANPEIARSIITNEDIKTLRDSLSEGASAILDNQGSDDDRRKLVVNWIVAAMTARFNPQVSSRDMMEFYDNEMTPEQRDRVNQLTPDRRRQDIRRLMMRRRFEGFGFPRGRRGRDEGGKQNGQAEKSGG